MPCYFSDSRVSGEKSESSSGKNSSGYRRDWGATHRKSEQGFIRRLRRFREVLPHSESLASSTNTVKGLSPPRNLESVPSLLRGGRGGEEHTHSPLQS